MSEKGREPGVDWISNSSPVLRIGELCSLSLTTYRRMNRRTTSNTDESKYMSNVPSLAEAARAVEQCSRAVIEDVLNIPFIDPADYRLDQFPMWGKFVASIDALRAALNAQPECGECEYDVAGGAAPLSERQYPECDRSKLLCPLNQAYQTRFADLERERDAIQARLDAATATFDDLVAATDLVADALREERAKVLIQSSREKAVEDLTVEAQIREAKRQGRIEGGEEMRERAARLVEDVAKVEDDTEAGNAAADAFNDRNRQPMQVRLEAWNGEIAKGIRALSLDGGDAPERERP